MSVNISKIQVKSFNQEEISMSKYLGKVLLIVNLASKCGFTKQYAGLQKLQNTYEKKGFHILGFPCNDFGDQEPGSLEEIKTFCSTNYQVTFELFNKVHAKGKTTEPYTTLNEADPSGDVEWNFEKFLVNKSGDVVSRFKSAVEPNNPELIASIERELSI